ncbi:MAG: LLM class flavin-dependent oxidoreductase, partial [Candidatus Limnocylindria bacterium]
MSPFERFGLALATTHPVEQVVAVARSADAIGVDAFWLAETYYHRSATPLAAAVGAATGRIAIGLGILPVHTRHPALLAMEAATLDEATGGRIVLGLGVARRVAELHGARLGLVGQMRRTVGAVRGLLDGEEVALDGPPFEMAATRIEVRPARRIPIHIGTYASSRQMLRLAGQIADGVVYIWATPHLVREAGEILGEAAERAGRQMSSIAVAAYLIISLDEDARRARDACRPLVATYARIVHEVWRRDGLATEADLEPVLAAFGSGGPPAAAAAVSDALIEKVAIAGDPDYCRDRLGEYEGTGLTEPIAYEVFGPDPIAALPRLATIVMRQCQP